MAFWPSLWILHKIIQVFSAKGIQVNTMFHISLLLYEGVDSLKKRDFAHEIHPLKIDNIDLGTASEWLGHTDISTTYSHYVYALNEPDSVTDWLNRRN